MARMRFLCDAERCIECNACVTACKNEHEVPWASTGVASLRLTTVSRANALSLLRVCTVPTHPALQCARLTASTRQSKGWFSTLRTSALVADIASTRAHSVRHNTRKQVTSDPEARWTSVPSALVDLRKTTPQKNTRSTGVTVWLKVNFRFVLKCAPQKHFSAVMATWLPTSTASGSYPVGSVRVLGVGVQLTT